MTNLPKFSTEPPEEVPEKISREIIEHCLAKINLTLQVTGKRDDGYHLLESTVVFAQDVYDVISIATSSQKNISVTGPYATVVPKHNSLTKTLEWLERYYNQPFNINISLHKNIPAGAGLGGGSADAAGLVRAVQKLYELPKISVENLVALGADVPVCYAQKAAIMQGIGEIVIPYTQKMLQKIPQKLPSALTLINPNINVETAAVFKTLKPTEWQQQPNDLFPAACRAFPMLKECYEQLKAVIPATCKLGMTGSGSTFFTDFLDTALLKQYFPDYWISETIIS